MKDKSDSFSLSAEYPNVLWHWNVLIISFEEVISMVIQRSLEIRLEYNLLMGFLVTYL